MAQPPPVLTAVPAERLNQIASRKLAALGIAVQPSADGNALEGDLVFPAGTVVNPATGRVLEFARFVVHGHDTLRFVDPPLSELAPLQFYNADTVDRLEERVAQALNSRLDALRPVEQALRALGLETTLEPNHLVQRAVLKADGWAFELLGAPGKVLVSRALPSGGTPVVVGSQLPPLDLTRFGTAEDLKRYLVEWMSSGGKASPPSPAPAPKAAPAKPAPAAQTAPLPSPAPVAQAAPPKPLGAATDAALVPVVPIKPGLESLTLSGMLQKFGDVALSPSTQIEIVQDYDVGGERYQFFALRDVGTVFSARLIGPLGDEWEESFDLLLFPGLASVFTSVLSRKYGRPVTLEATQAPGTAQAVGALPAPAAGQFWVMTVVVEQELGDEVRYVGLNADGKPYGAARILKKQWFEQAFIRGRGGWMLVIRIEQVAGNDVYYVQVDPQRAPKGELRKMDIPALLSTFLPES